MADLNFEMISLTDNEWEDEFYGMTQEEWQKSEQDHWNNKGHIEFFVLQNTKDNFEIEIIDYSGCAGGLQDTLGIDYAIEDMWCLREELKLREGVFYTIHGVTVTWTRGDGWTTDDDVDYEYESISHHTTLWLYLSHKILMIWWRAIGWRIKKWRQSP